MIQIKNRQDFYPVGNFFAGTFIYVTKSDSVENISRNGGLQN